MGKHDEKTKHAAHIKRHTVGTSNEISFSVLDAAKNALDGEKGLEDEKKGLHFGGISLFTMPHKKKAISTPTKESGLPLSTGDFVSVDPAEATGVPALPVGSSASALTGRGGTLGLPSGEGSGINSINGVVDGGTTGLGNLGGAGAMWPTPADEVARRKTTRKRRRLLVYLLVFLAVAGLAGSAGWWLWQNYQTHQSHVSELDQALADIERTDEVLTPLNDALGELIELPEGSVAGEGLVATFASLEGQLPQAVADLQSAQALTETALAGMADSVDKEAANQAVVAIEARLDMADLGGQIAADAAAASGAAGAAKEAWDLLLKADALAREAALMVVETTDENVTASLDKTNQALELFRQADDRFAQAADRYPAADFSPYRTYLAKRIEAMGYAVAADEAFLAKNKEETIAQNDAYNQADAEAASLAADLSDDPVRMVADVSDAANADARNAYATACSQAASADAFLRDYLGTTSK